MANPLPAPGSDPIADLETGAITDVWFRWLNEVSLGVSQDPNRTVTPPAITAQAASIWTTILAPSQTAAGLYRFAWYARITQAATIASSLTVRVDWTDHGQACSFSGAAMLSNLVTEFQSETKMIYSDAGIPITYETAYVSNAAATMTYELYVFLESVSL